MSASPCLKEAAGLGSGVEPAKEGFYTPEHFEMRAALNKLIEKEINPHVEKWEEAKMFPAQEVRGQSIG